RMTPALLIRTLSDGCRATTSSAKALIASWSSTSRVIACIRSRPAIVSSSVFSRRPATITAFPSSLNRRASSRPIPEPPPVIRIVFPVVFILAFFDLSADDVLLCMPGGVPADLRRNHLRPSYLGGFYRERDQETCHTLRNTCLILHER